MLPAPNSPWPPKALEEPYRDIEAWSAWWGGSPDMLSRVYGGFATPTEQSFSQQSWTNKGGLLGIARTGFRRFFWGQTPSPGQQSAKVHLPLAAEVATMSADLLFGEPPHITVEDDATQDRLGALLGEDAHAQLHDAAEACAALGSVYLRVGWDLELDPDGPLLSVVDADAALPVYREGRLREVTFIREVSRESGVLRHLEHHEPGWVRHALYLGTATNLGRPVPLTEDPETADLIDSISLDDTGMQGIPTGLTRLDVVPVINARSRTWRHLPVGRDMGRADIAGSEGLLDELDDVWSSWMRDIRHARSRIHVPQHYLETRGPGQGARFDLDRELYVGLDALPDDVGMQITATQLLIRWQEHSESGMALIERIVSACGYDPQTFGLNVDTALTATESWARQVRSQNTRKGKLRRWRPAVADLALLLLEVDNIHFRGSNRLDQPIEVNFPDTVSESLASRAQTANLLRGAEAASTGTLVKMVHQDWDQEQVDEEVAAIEGEKPAAPDPLGMFDQLPRDNTQPANEPPEADGERPEPGKPQTAAAGK